MRCAAATWVTGAGHVGRSGGQMMADCECARVHAVVTAAGGGATKPSLMKREK